eukprot:CAMPEP_0181093378 /NCGR_PEP_ID=MMETSP1071-20121207/9415_1 /TAXON_ID=35127 /ORGANISM="Thalassiosira sp., Strain NH16" /LENGTH=127 /DNA_ID=CAMNT_0023175611 /DNA_START=70 /DNA_END=453 /DNA_ORIENTATION=+
MKSFATIVVFATCIASSSAKVDRRRTNIAHKSSAPIEQATEAYDPYLDMAHDDRKLAGHENHSMSMSMPHKEEGDGHDDHDHDDHGDETKPAPDGDKTTEPDADKSSAFAARSAVSVLAAAGAMMLL